LYAVDKQPDGRYAIKRLDNAQVYGIYNSGTVARKETRRLNGEPKEPEISCGLNDGPGFLVCLGCHEEVQAGAFYYIVNSKIICEKCKERLNLWGRGPSVHSEGL
jgi:hypothetical protein